MYVLPAKSDSDVMCCLHAVYTVANFRRYPIRSRVIKASALELLTFDTIFNHSDKNVHAVYIHLAFRASNFVTECLPKVDLKKGIMISLHLHENKLECNV